MTKFWCFVLGAGSVLALQYFAGFPRVGSRKG